MDLEEALRRESLQRNDVTRKIKEVAFILREDILTAPVTPLPENLTLDDILNGEIKTPNSVALFLHHLIGGLDSRWGNTETKKRRIDSIGQDLVYATTSGRYKPSKHLRVGLALKSITGSKKALVVLNRLSHIASPTTLEEVETELTFEATKNGLLTPNGMSLDPMYGTGVAFDNYDRFVETLNGKDTLHDTVGIIYQTIPEEDTGHQSKRKANEEKD